MQTESHRPGKITIDLIQFVGQLMSTFKNLLKRMSKLCDLRLIDQVLEKYEANSLMDVISLQLNKSMKEFTAINLTVNHCPFQQIAILSNLKVSPFIRSLAVIEQLLQLFF